VFYSYHLTGSDAGQNTYASDIVNVRVVIEHTLDDKRGFGYNFEFVGFHGLPLGLMGIRSTWGSEMDSPPSAYNRRFNAGWANILSERSDACSPQLDNTRRMPSIQIFMSLYYLSNIFIVSYGGRDQELANGGGYLVTDPSEYLSPLFGGLCDGGRII
jgi:hypothetical protein